MVHKNKTCKVLLLTILVYLFVGCASTSDTPKKTRGKLSEAMEKSREANAEERQVSDTKIEYDHKEPYPLRKRYHKDENRFNQHLGDKDYGIRINNSLIYSKDINGEIGSSFVIASHTAPKRRLSLDLGFSYSPMNLESKLSKSIDGYLEGHIGLQRRIYSTPDHTLMGLFMLFGADVRFIAWTYKNPIKTAVYDEFGNFISDELINSDGLNGLSFHLGAGWSFIQSKHIKLSAELCLLGAIYGFETWENFENDVFPTSAQVRLVLEAVLTSNN